MNNSSKKFLLVGGGSGGPVAPLLAVAIEIKKLNPGAEFLFVGTSTGPGRQMAESAGIRFQPMSDAKLRRYFSIRNLIDIFVLVKNLFVARRLIKKFQPDVVIGAGASIAVPVSWAAWWCGVKVVMHQQDIRLGLANKLIRPVAGLITCAFESSAKQFISGSGLTADSIKPGAHWVGNPVRSEFFKPLDPKVSARLGLVQNLPVILAVGGGTGAVQINNVVAQAAPELAQYNQIVHVVGPGKKTTVQAGPHYHQFEFIGDDFPDALKLADIVITRAGISTIAELSVLGKVSIVVPMPGSHQDDNGLELFEKNAAIVLGYKEFNAPNLIQIIKGLRLDAHRQEELSQNIKRVMPHDAAHKMAKLIYEYSSQK